MRCKVYHLDNAHPGGALFRCSSRRKVLVSNALEELLTRAQESLNAENAVERRLCLADQLHVAWCPRLAERHGVHAERTRVVEEVDFHHAQQTRNDHGEAMEPVR